MGLKLLESNRAGFQLGQLKPIVNKYRIYTEPAQKESFLLCFRFAFVFFNPVGVPMSNFFLFEVVKVQYLRVYCMVAEWRSGSVLGP